MAEVRIERRHGGHGSVRRDLCQEAIKQTMVCGNRGPGIAKARADRRVAPGDLAGQAPGEQPNDERYIGQMQAAQAA